MCSLCIIWVFFTIWMDFSSSSREVPRQGEFWHFRRSRRQIPSWLSQYGENIARSLSQTRPVWSGEMILIQAENWSLGWIHNRQCVETTMKQKCVGGVNFIWILIGKLLILKQWWWHRFVWWSCRAEWVFLLPAIWHCLKTLRRR